MLAQVTDLAITGVLLGSGLLLPGWLLARRVPSPAPWLSAFLGSAVLLFELVLALDTLHLPLDRQSVALGLAALNVGLLAISLRVAPARLGPAGDGGVLPRGWDRLWLLPAVLALGAIAVRAIAEPLSGYDHVFRWDFLARQMLRTGTLAYYPPVTAADFNAYAWCDGIPPLVPVLNFWSYLSAGTARGVATAPRVLLEALLLFHGVWRLARGRWGADAGWPATAVLASSALALWGVAMGQETGLTALTLTAMLVFLDEHRRTPDRSALFWAGLCAGAGALSREYGLAWPLIGLGTLAWHRQLRNGWKLFGTTAAAVAAPWYLRNWIHTGNPLFSHGLGGIFPTNPVHEEFMRLTAELYRPGANPGLVPFALQSLAVIGGFTVWLGLVSGLRAARPAAPLLVGGLLVAALWFWSIGQTAGGWIYAMRVLTPALALAAALAGRWLAQPGVRGRLLAAGFVLLSADAAWRSLYLPSNPLIAPWEYSPTRWRDFGTVVAATQEPARWAAIARSLGPSGVIVDDPGRHALLTAAGAHAVPLVSPEAADIFQRDRSFGDTAARLRARGLRFAMLSPHSLLLARFARENPFLDDLARQRPVLDAGDFLLYDLQSIAP
ncbi:MAG TPA: hypothetical protein VG838_10380 [Opitutaceae bacterium]|nr:hypothetical protein [Opitutaceae bacterium]